MITVNGLGPMAGSDPYQAADIIAGEASGLFLPLLIDAGIEHGLVARTLWLSDSTFAPGPRGWRHAGTSLATARVRDHHARLLDACEEVWKNKGRSIEKVTVTLMGPLSLAGLVELGNGHLILTDRRAMAGLWEEILWGVEEFRTTCASHFGEEVSLNVLVTEPLAHNALHGTIPGTSQLDPIAPIPIAEVSDLWATPVPCPLLFDGGAHTAALPAQALPAQATPVLSLAALARAYARNETAQIENAMAVIDRGGPVGIRLGAHKASAKDLTQQILRIWEKLGFDPETVADRVRIIEAHPRHGEAPATLFRRDCVATDGGLVEVSTATSLHTASVVADALIRG